MNDNNFEEEYMEIDLRELFYTIWKRKYIIISLFIISILLAGIYSKIISQPVYKTEATLLTPSFNLLNGNTINKEEYLSFTEDKGVIKNVIEKYNLDKNKPDFKYTSLIESLNINQNEDNNKITLTFKHTNSEEISNILNDWIVNFKENVNNYITENNNEYLRQINNKVNKEYKNYQKVLNEYTEFKKNNNLNLLNSRLQKKENKLVSLESKIENINNNLERTKTEYSSVIKQLSQTDKNVILTQTLNENTLRQLKVFTKNNDIVGLIKSSNEQINPVHTSLINQKNNLDTQLESMKTGIKTYKKEINKLNKTITELTQTISEKTEKRTLLKNELNIAENRYNSIQNTYNNLYNKLSQRNYKISVINEPTIPTKVSPNTKLNLAIAGVLSIMLGVFLVFMIEYFKDTDWKKLKENNTTS